MRARLQLLLRIAAAIDAADRTAILARPFTDECPRSFDGRELTCRLPTAARADVVIASCTTQIDPGQEPAARPASGGLHATTSGAGFARPARGRFARPAR